MQQQPYIHMQRSEYITRTIKIFNLFFFLFFLIQIHASACFFLFENNHRTKPLGEKCPINAEMVSYLSAVERCSKIGSVVYNNDTKGQACDNQGLLCKRKGFWTSIRRYENLRCPSVHGTR